MFLPAAIFVSLMSCAPGNPRKMVQGRPFSRRAPDHHHAFFMGGRACRHGVVKAQLVNEDREWRASMSRMVKDARRRPIHHLQFTMRHSRIYTTGADRHI